MAKIFNVSIPECEKDLIKWLEEKVAKNELSPSLILRDALVERKRQDDTLHSKNPAILHERINNLKKVIGLQTLFIQERKLMEDFIRFTEKESELGIKTESEAKETEAKNEL